MPINHYFVVEVKFVDVMLQPIMTSSQTLHIDEPNEINYDTKYQCTATNPQGSCTLCQCCCAL